MIKGIVNRFLKRQFSAEKGFTLIELLVVIAILGILAAVVVPNVGRFMGEGEDEAGLTELHTVLTAVTSMISDQRIAVIVSPVDDPSSPTNDMTAFPSSGNNTQVLFGDPASGGTHYLHQTATAYWYTCDASGTVSGWWTADGSNGPVGYRRIGLDPPPP